jgi:hypothetical protein
MGAAYRGKDPHFWPECGFYFAMTSGPRKHPEYSECLSDDPEVLNLAASGYDAFQKRTAARILGEHSDIVFLNRCPKSGGLTRTPKAKQCRFCDHDWHRRFQTSSQI